MRSKEHLWNSAVQRALCQVHAMAVERRGRNFAKNSRLRYRIGEFFDSWIAAAVTGVVHVWSLQMHALNGRCPLHTIHRHARLGRARTGTLSFEASFSSGGVTKVVSTTISTRAENAVGGTTGRPRRMRLLRSPAKIRPTSPRWTIPTPTMTRSIPLL